MPKQKLSDKKRDRMYAVWCQKENIAFVAAKCGVSEGSVRKYKKVDRWPERREESRQERHKELDREIVSAEVKRIQAYEAIINAILNPYIRQLNELKEARLPVELHEPLSLAEKLERLVKFLKGEPDSRPDNRSSTTVNIFNKPIEELSDEELADRKRRNEERLARLGFYRRPGGSSRLSSDN